MVLGAKALLGLAAMIDLGMLASSLLMWSGTVTVWAPLVVVIPIMAGVLVALIVLARNNRDWNAAEEGTGLVHRDDDKHWRGGLIYINRSRPRVVRPPALRNRLDDQRRQPAGRDAPGRASPP